MAWQVLLKICISVFLTRNLKEAYLLHFVTVAVVYQCIYSYEEDQRGSD